MGGVSEWVPLTSLASGPTAATAAPKRTQEGSARVLGQYPPPWQLLRPRQGRCCTIPCGYDRTHPKMLILTVFYKIECSLQKNLL